MIRTRCPISSSFLLLANQDARSVWQAVRVCTDRHWVCVGPASVFSQQLVTTAIVRSLSVKTGASVHRSNMLPGTSIRSKQTTYGTSTIKFDCCVALPYSTSASRGYRLVPANVLAMSRPTSHVMGIALRVYRDRRMTTSLPLSANWTHLHKITFPHLLNEKGNMMTTKREFRGCWFARYALSVYGTTNTRWYFWAHQNEIYCSTLSRPSAGQIIGESCPGIFLTKFKVTSMCQRLYAVLQHSSIVLLQSTVVL